MSWMTIAGIGCLLVFLFALGVVVGGTYETYRAGGVRDLQRDVFIAIQEYDELLSLLSAPPQKERGTLHRLPVAVVERSPLTLINGDAS